jgi:aspartyl-tRNA(Asn)/glutamyl-tRNA(Gln) amidotransferase subunit B
VMQAHFVSDYALSEYDATTLTASKPLTNYFLAITDIVSPAQAKQAANWVLGEVSALLNEREVSADRSPVSATQLALLITRVQDGTISGKIAKELFRAIADGEAGNAENAADTLIEQKGLKQVSDAGAIEKIVDEVLSANAKSVEEFKSGKEKAFQALVGQVMKASKGKANPAQVNEILKQKLA